jgi:acetyltransferase
MMFGLGGIFVEVLKDVSFRAVPLNRKDAMDMMNEIQTSKILDGVRGNAPVDKEALADLMIKLSQFCIAHPEISELDLNPVMAYEDGFEIIDSRIILKKNVATKIEEKSKSTKTKKKASK